MKNAFLILGAGLAGTAVAWELQRRGKPFHLVDPQVSSTSSQVAAGIVNPITGPQLRLNWRADFFLTEMRESYRHIAQVLGQNHFRDLPLLRLLPNSEQAELLSRRLEDERYRPYIAEHGMGTPNADYLQKANAWYLTSRSGVLNTKGYLRASWDFFASNLDQVELGMANEEEIEPDPAGGIRWRGRSFRGAIVCTGIHAQQGRFFSTLPFRPAKGEVLGVNTDLPTHQILNRGGKWMVPPGEKGGLYRAGATYDWGEVMPDPSPQGREEIENTIRDTINVPFDIVSHEAGVRPVIAGHRPVAGIHPELPSIACLNGLGSKGVLYAPAIARMLVDTLIENRPMDPEIDVRRNF